MNERIERLRAVPRGAAAGLGAGQCRLPDRLLQLECGGSRRARPGPALQRLPLRRGRAGCRGRRVRPGGARPLHVPRGAALGQSRVRGRGRDLPPARVAARGRDRARAPLRARRGAAGRKDEDEIAVIRRAAEITSQALERFAEEQFTGRTERDLAWRLDQLFHELGGDGPSFESIVASGPNGARPHARPTDRKIEPGETVVIDAGARVGAYNPDCTRTFATGPLPDRLQEAYDVCLRAQLAGLDAIRPGLSGIDADPSAREVIEEAGLGEQFGHGLGHGLGLEVHEAPRLSRESRDTLAERQVVTVEPGIYLEGLGGIRIEDLVVVREGEPEILTSFTKELVTVT